MTTRNDVFTIEQFTFSPTEGITAKTDDGVKKISMYARITRAFIDTNTNEQTFELQYRHKLLNDIHSITITYKSLLPTGIVSLIKFGLDVTNINRNDLCNALMASLSQAQVVYVNHNYGFDSFNDQEIFVTDRIHASKPIEEEIQIAHSSYDLKPTGSLNAWTDMYKNHVQGHKELELATAIGLSSPILAYLKQKHPDLKSLMIHLSGDSTSGKTTALSLAVSVAGSPNSGEKSLLRHWNGTLTSVMASLENFHGIPIAFDELSTNTNSNLTSLVYSLTEGIGRARANVDGSLKEVGSWSTVILSSGELSIYNRLSHNIGLRVRVFDFENIQWTDSADQAENIKQMTSQNYGHLLPALMDQIFEAGLEVIEDSYQENMQKLVDLMPESLTKQRVASKLAIILTTADLANQSELISINMENLTEMLVNYEVEHLDDRNLGEAALDKLMQYLIVNKRALTKYGHNTLGYLEGNTVCIYREQLANVLNKLGFEDSQIVVKRWITSHDIVPSEGDRQTTRKIVDGVRLISYKIRIPESYLQAGLRESSYSAPILLTPNEEQVNQRITDYTTNATFDDVDFDF